MPVTTNTRKLAALLGASGAGIGTDGTLQAAVVGANLATQAELDAVSATVTSNTTLANLKASQVDFNSMETDVALLAMYRASDHSKETYNLTDQVIDTFTDAGNIDAGASTNETLISGAFGYGTTAAGLDGFKYMRQYILSGDYHDANAGGGAMNYDNGTGTAGHHTVSDITRSDSAAFNSADNKLFATINHSDSTYAGSWHTAGSGNAEYATFTYTTEAAAGTTKLYVGKYRTNGDPRTMKLTYSLDGVTYTEVPIAASGMTYNTNQGLSSVSLSRSAANILAMTAFPGNGNSGWSTVEGGANWSHTPAANITLVSNASTASSAPTKGDLVMQIENSKGTATINTDIKGYISRDSGTNWTLGTLVDEGSWGTNKKVLAFHDLDISSQPSGTAIRYKITTHNQVTATKFTKIHGVSFGWA